MLTALLPTPAPIAPGPVGTAPRPVGTAAERRRRAAHPAWRYLPLVVAALTTLLVLIVIAGPDRLATVFGAADGALLAGAVLLQALSLLCFANLYRATHAVVSEADLTAAGRGAGTVGLAAFGLTQALPGGGVAGGALALRRFQQFGSRPLTAASSVVHIGLVSLAGLCLVVTATLGWAAVTTGQHAAVAGTGLLLCATLLGGFVLARRAGVYERLQHLLLGRLADLLAPRAGDGGDRFALPAPRAEAAAPLVGVHALARPLTWSVGKWALDLTVLTLVVRAVGGTVPLAAIAVAYAAVNLINSIPLTPGGLGLVEGGLSASLLAAGLDLGSAAAATLAYRAVSYWLPLAACVPAALHHLGAARGPGRGDVPADGQVTGQHAPERAVASPLSPALPGTSDPAGDLASPVV